MRTVHFGKKLVFSFVVAACVSQFAFSAVAQAQDSSQKSGDDAVADAARKARDKKKETPKPKRVFTNEDLGELKSNSVSTVGQDSNGAASPANGAENDQNQGDKAKAKAAPGSDAAAKDQEQVWRQRFRDAYAKLAQLEKELDILQREDNKAQLQYYPDPQKAMSEGYTRKDINDKQAKITAKQHEIDQQKERIGDMQDDLRKAGGDPGWASPQ